MEKSKIVLSEIEKYGEKWILRDLDFFPEKFSDLIKSGLYPQYNKLSLFYNIINGKIISFNTEIEAIEASIKIYRDIFKKPIPYSLLEKFAKITIDKKNNK